MSDRGIVEAALYSAGRALTIDDLMRVTGFDEATVKEHLRALAREYKKRESALEVAQIGTRWTMQIRQEYTERARTFAPPEIDRDLLKTAALITYHQPILQSDLFDMIGEKVYEHTKTLEDLKLITRKPSGRSLELTTTRYFAEFFGLKTTNREGIRKIMAERAGIVYREKPADVEVPEPAPDAAPDTTSGPGAIGPPPPEGWEWCRDRTGIATGRTVDGQGRRVRSPVSDLPRDRADSGRDRRAAEHRRDRAAPGRAGSQALVSRLFCRRILRHLPAFQCVEPPVPGASL